MQEKIVHEGIVTSVEKDTVHVKFEAKSACGSCHAKGLCNMSEKTDKEVVVKTRDAADYAPGEPVYVYLMSGMGLRAVLYAYVLSLVAGAVGFIAASFCTPNQAVWALVALLCIALYFVGLHLYGKRLNRKFSFGIGKRSEPNTNGFQDELSSKKTIQ